MIRFSTMLQKHADLLGGADSVANPASKRLGADSADALRPDRSEEQAHRLARQAEFSLEVGALNDAVFGPYIQLLGGALDISTQQALAIMAYLNFMDFLAK